MNIPSELTVRSARGDIEQLVEDWQRSLESELFDFSIAPQWTVHAAVAAGMVAQLRAVGLYDRQSSLKSLGLFLEEKQRILGIPATVRELPGNRLVAYHNEMPGQCTAQLVEAIAAAGGKRCDVVNVPAVIRGGVTDQCVSEVASRRRWTITRAPGYRSPFITIREPWESYLAHKSRSFRYALQRKRRALEGVGAVSMRWYGAGDTVAELLESIATIESSSWKAQEQMAITGSEQETRYYAALLPWLAERDALTANVLFVGEEPTAYSLCYRWGGRIAQMKTSFDERFQNVSPGLIVNAEAIRNAFESGAREFDFLGDIMPHKSFWTDEFRIHDHLFVYTDTVVGRAVGFAKSRLNRLRPNNGITTTGRGARLKSPAKAAEPAGPSGAGDES